MRFVTKNEAIRRAFLADLKREGIKFELHERLSYESFAGYLLEGTLEEIGAKIEVLNGADREALKEGFLSFKESLNHLLEHIKVGEHIESLIQEGPWMAELLDQLMKNGAIDYSDGVVKLKEDVDIMSLKFEFKFPFNLVHNPEGVEKVAKQFALTDLIPEYEFEILELDIAKINTLGKLASRYFPEDYLLRVYFALIGRAIVATEVLKAIGKEKVPEEDLINAFLKTSPMEVPTEKGTLVINFTRKALEETLRLLKKFGYIEIKAGKVKKLKNLF